MMAEQYICRRCESPLDPDEGNDGMCWDCYDWELHEERPNLTLWDALTIYDYELQWRKPAPRLTWQKAVDNDRITIYAPKLSPEHLKRQKRERLFWDYILFC
jgi:hypothetical protein